MISRLKARGVYTAVLYQIFSFVWNIAYSIELTRINPGEMIFWDKVCIACAALIPLFFLLYTAEFTRYAAIYKIRWLFPLILVSGIFISLIFSNDQHHLVFARSWTVVEGTSRILVHQYGPVMWGIFAYGVILTLCSVIILVMASRRSLGFYRRHASVMSWSAFVPILAALIHLTKLIPTAITGTSVGIAITGALVTLSFIRLDRQDIIGISKSVAFDGIAPGIIVFNEQDQVVDISDKSVHMLGISRQDILGKQLHDLFPSLTDMESLPSGNAPTIENDGRVLELSCTPLSDWQNNILGKIVILQDITRERKRSNELSLLLESSRSIASSRESKTILQILASQLLEISGFQSCAILEWDKERKNINLRFDHTRLQKVEDANEYYDLQKYPTTKEALVTGRPVILQGVINAEEKEWMLELGRKGVIIFPLEVKGQVIGLAELAATKSNLIFDDEDIAGCKAILSGMAEDLLNPISQTDPKKLHLLGVAMMNATGAEVCSLSDWERDENRLRTVIVDADDYWEPGQGPAFDTAHYGLYKSVLLHGTATSVVWGENAQKENEFLKEYALSAKSYLIFPLQKGDEQIGIIELYDFYRAQNIGQDKIALLRALSDQAGFTIYNARLYAELQQEVMRSARLVRELEEKNAELERFTYTVSHDLKSPLVTINGFIGYLEKDARSGNMERFSHDVQRIQEAVNKMRRLLGELLELSRIGRLINAPEMISFTDLVQDALNTVHGQLEERGVAVIVQPDLPSVCGDRPRLTEILQNLVDNAAKFMGDQPNPQIEIGQQYDNEEHDRPVFFVKDNGVGIPEAQQERIFGLFNKLDATSDGTGIGLAIVKRIVEVHGGRIWVESTPGKGATFFFTLSNRQASEVAK
jgi:signal transduction histidine kinase/PAS domain-containing protein